MRGTGVDHPLQPGDHVGTYQLKELIGAGAISQVWRAHLPSDERRPVAIKILNERIHVQDAAREHFRHEAELMMRVRCPQILRVFNYEKTRSGRPYIVMELLDGQDLKSYLSRHGPLSIEEALMVAIELLKALSELHRVGHIHSDLKPDNVFLLNHQDAHQEIRIKLIDFGSAVSLSTPSQQALTQGSYLYMAPEQLRRQPLSPATDLYGLGALMFTLISGKPPFQPTLADGLDAHLSQPVPKIRERVPNAPVQLERLLELCLHSKQDKRPASADALRRTLERLLSERKRRPVQNDRFLPADEPELFKQEGSSRPRSHPPLQRSIQPNHRSAPPMALSIGPAPNFDDDDDANPQELLRWLLKSYTGELAEDWARSISETPNFGRVQPHLVKVNATYYITLFSQIQARKLSPGFLVLIDQLTPNLNPKSPEIAPLMCGPLLTPSLNKYMGDWSEQIQDAVRGELYDLFYLAHQAFVEAILVRYPNEYEAQLKRVFSNSIELLSLSSLSGQLRYTQPGLRSVFGASDESELKRRELFDLLTGYQGLLSLRRDFREVSEGIRDQFGRFVILHHPHAKGRALTLKISPHLLRRDSISSVMILFEMLEERQIVEPLSISEVGDDYAPQAPLWVETMEVSALGHEQFEGYYNQTIGEDEPTPIPGEISPSRAPIEADWVSELDISPPSSPYAPVPVQFDGLEAFDPTAPYDRISTFELEVTHQEIVDQNQREVFRAEEPHYSHDEPGVKEESTADWEIAQTDQRDQERSLLYASEAQSKDQDDSSYDDQEWSDDLQFESEFSEEFVEESARSQASSQESESTDDYGSSYTELELKVHSAERSVLYEVEVSSPPERFGPERKSRLSSLAPDAAQRVQSDAPGAQSIVAITLQDSPPIRQAQLKQAFESVKGANLTDDLDLYRGLIHTHDHEMQIPRRSNSLPAIPVTVDHENPIYRAEGYQDLKVREEGPSSPRPRPSKIIQSVIHSQLPKSQPPEQQEQLPYVARPELSTVDMALVGRAALTLDTGRSQYVQKSATPSPIDTSQRPRRRLPTVTPDALHTPKRSSTPVASARLQSTNGRLMLHLGVFCLIAGLSWVYLPQIKAVLSGHVSLSSFQDADELPQGLPPVDTNQVPALPQSNQAINRVQATEPALQDTRGRSELSPEAIRLIVTTKANVFVLDQRQNEQLLCEGSMVCDVPLNRDVIVRAEGYYERPLYRLELSEHRGSEWMLNLVKTNR